MKPGEGNAITGLLESAINRYLAEDCASTTTLTQLDGKLIELQLKNLDLSVFMRFLQGQILLSINEPATADACLSGSPLALARFFLGSEAPAIHIDISGDPAPVQKLRALLSGINIDWEEHLSRIVGDVAAHRIGRQFKQTAKTSGITSRAFIDDIGDYLREETQLLVHPIELDEFTADIGKLTNDVDAVAARIEHLTATLPGSQA